ncbi:MAG: undecaprenyl diphosphate synthase family protein, partial [Halomonadaceae bacterium]
MTPPQFPESRSGAGESGAESDAPAVPAAMPGAVPAHVAIIMDGNNRWARTRGLSGVRGHRAGVESVRAVI